MSPSKGEIALDRQPVHSLQNARTLAWGVLPLSGFPGTIEGQRTMMQAIATDRPGAVRILLVASRATCLLGVGLVVWLAMASWSVAESANESPETPAAGSTADSATSRAARRADELEKIVAEKIGEPTIRCIGPVTTITEVSSGFPFPARVDTGATTCSIHYEAMEIEDPADSPEDNVGKRVRILVKGPDGKEDWINTKIVDRVRVRTSTDDDERYKVQLKLRWQDVEKKVLVTLSDREKMKYPVLLGRNFLRGDFLVDVNLAGDK